ncbi:MAG: isocitrate lyase/phosphoenolpyruvate mutase family protein [Planctomycetes bacterium]|nr:isocitrate lyase/phosphoenolpyruvate mutase family protein [Planctomycetota bacterium]
MGVHDGLGARLAEEAGFAALWASGLEISASAAVPDAGILTMTQMLDAATQIARASRLPVIADCDTGFGNSSNVIHMVKSYEAAGIAAVCIEDKRFPKLNSFVEGRQELAGKAEFVGKLMAAKSAQRGEHFVVIARTEALIAGHGLDEALERAEAYRRAGADAILVHSKAREPDEVLAFLERWQRRAPVVIVPTTYPRLTATQWKDSGADVVIYANQGLRASIRALETTFARIRADDGTAGVEGEIAPLARVFELQGMPALRADEARFLRGAKRARVVVPAGGDIDLPDDLAALLRDGGPRALLDLYGKRLVERQREAFRRAGVPELLLVGPFRGDEHAFEGVTLVPGEGPSMLDSIRAGLRRDAHDRELTSLLCYSDILLTPPVAAALLACEDEIAVLVDGSFRDSRRARRKRLDLVRLDEPLRRGERVLDPGRPRRVLNIGKHLAPDEAHAEFIGLAAFGPGGRALLLEACERWAAEPARRFGHAPSFAAATLTDALQELVDDGHVVTAVEQDRGWMEIHDFEDYRSAIEQLSRE